MWAWILGLPLARACCVNRKTALRHRPTATRQKYSYPRQSRLTKCRNIGGLHGGRRRLCPGRDDAIGWMSGSPQVDDPSRSNPGRLVSWSCTGRRRTKRPISGSIGRTDLLLRYGIAAPTAYAVVSDRHSCASCTSTDRYSR